VTITICFAPAHQSTHICCIDQTLLGDCGAVSFAVHADLSLFIHLTVHSLIGVDRLFVHSLIA